MVKTSVTVTYPQGQWFDPQSPTEDPLIFSGFWWTMEQTFTTSMREVKQEPVFEIGLLLRSASLAGINTRDIPSNANPWTWKDPRAMSWQSAIRSLSPVLAQDAEIYWGEPLSLALQAAVDGQGEWTPELDQEFAAKRPHQREERREAAVKAALEGMAANLQAEREARAARTPTPEQLQSQLIASRNAAYASLAQQHCSGEA